ncbi:unnamed protein product [Amoebophrya sp. A120]|nr:unnamed protein product [Amoebophrya sp. A120]|eukprot:GSA120T00002509001.1
MTGTHTSVLLVPSRQVSSTTRIGNRSWSQLLAFCSLAQEVLVNGRALTSSTVADVEAYAIRQRRLALLQQRQQVREAAASYVELVRHHDVKTRHSTDETTVSQHLGLEPESGGHVYSNDANAGSTTTGDPHDDASNTRGFVDSSSRQENGDDKSKTANQHEAGPPSVAQFYATKRKRVAQEAEANAMQTEPTVALELGHSLSPTRDCPTAFGQEPQPDVRTDLAEYIARDGGGGALYLPDHQGDTIQGLVGNLGFFAQETRGPSNDKIRTSTAKAPHSCRRFFLSDPEAAPAEPLDEDGLFDYECAGSSFAKDTEDEATTAASLLSSPQTTAHHQAGLVLLSSSIKAGNDVDVEAASTSVQRVTFQKPFGSDCVVVLAAAHPPMLTDPQQLRFFAPAQPTCIEEVAQLATGDVRRPCGAGQNRVYTNDASVRNALQGLCMCPDGNTYSVSGDEKLGLACDGGVSHSVIETEATFANPALQRALLSEGRRVFCGAAKPPGHPGNAAYKRAAAIGREGSEAEPTCAEEVDKAFPRCGHQNRNRVVLLQLEQSDQGAENGQTGDGTVREEQSSGYGGQCQCPDGTIYNVGSVGDQCASLACYGGLAIGECERVDRPWRQGRAVYCDALAPAAARSTFSANPDKQERHRPDQRHAVLSELESVPVRSPSACAEDPDNLGHNPCPAAKNTVQTNVQGVGSFGGLCRCPDGSAYMVGDNLDSCASLACENALSIGYCEPIERPHALRASRRVVCAAEGRATSPVISESELYKRSSSTSTGAAIPAPPGQNNEHEVNTMFFGALQMAARQSSATEDHQYRALVESKVRCLEPLDLRGDEDLGAPCPTGPNQVFTNQPGIGVDGYGGHCLCPDGTAFAVGAQDDTCLSLACDNGQALSCGQGELTSALASPQRALLLVGRKVVCALADNAAATEMHSRTETKQFGSVGEQELPPVFLQEASQQDNSLSWLQNFFHHDQNEQDHEPGDAVSLSEQNKLSYTSEPEAETSATSLEDSPLEPGHRRGTSGAEHSPSARKPSAAQVELLSVEQASRQAIRMLAGDLRRQAWNRNEAPGSSLGKSSELRTGSDSRSAGESGESLSKQASDRARNNEGQVRRPPAPSWVRKDISVGACNEKVSDGWFSCGSSRLNRVDLVKRQQGGREVEVGKSIHRQERTDWMAECKCADGSVYVVTGKVPICQSLGCYGGDLDHESCAPAHKSFVGSTRSVSCQVAPARSTSSSAAFRNADSVKNGRHLSGRPFASFAQTREAAPHFAQEAGERFHCAEDAHRLALKGGCPAKRNVILANQPNVGTFGGICACADGSKFAVGDNQDDCASLACVNGVAGKCHRTGHAALLRTSRKVICAPGPPVSVGTKELQVVAVSDVSRTGFTLHTGTDGAASPERSAEKVWWTALKCGTGHLASGQRFHASRTASVPERAEGTSLLHFIEPQIRDPDSAASSLSSADTPEEQQRGVVHIEVEPDPRTSKRTVSTSAVSLVQQRLEGEEGSSASQKIGRAKVGAGVPLRVPASSSEHVVIAGEPGVHVRSGPFFSPGSKELAFAHHPDCEAEPLLDATNRQSPYLPWLASRTSAGSFFRSDSVQLPLTKRWHSVTWAESSRIEPAVASSSFVVLPTIQEIFPRADDSTARERLSSGATKAVIARIRHVTPAGFQVQFRPIAHDVPAGLFDGSKAVRLGYAVVREKSKRVEERSSALRTTVLPGTPLLYHSGVVSIAEDEPAELPIKATDLRRRGSTPPRVFAALQTAENRAPLLLRTEVASTGEITVRAQRIRGQGSCVWGRASKRERLGFVVLEEGRTPRGMNGGSETEEHYPTPIRTTLSKPSAIDEASHSNVHLQELALTEIGADGTSDTAFQHRRDDEEPEEPPPPAGPNPLTIRSVSLSSETRQIKTGAHGDAADKERLVVLLGPVAKNEPDAAFAAMDAMEGETFSARVREYNLESCVPGYLTGGHGSEEVSYSVWDIQTPHEDAEAGFAQLSYISSQVNDVPFRTPFAPDASVIVIISLGPKYSARERVARVTRVLPQGFSVRLTKPFPAEAKPGVAQTGEPARFNGFNNKTIKASYFAVADTKGQVREWIDEAAGLLSPNVTAMQDRLVLVPPVERGFFYASLIMDVDDRWARIDSVDMSLLPFLKVFATIQSQHDATPAVLRYRVLPDGVYLKIQNVEKCGWMEPHRMEKVGVFLHEGVDESGAPIKFRTRVREHLATAFYANNRTGSGRELLDVRNVTFETEIAPLFEDASRSTDDVLDDLRKAFKMPATEKLALPNVLTFEPTERDVVEYLRQQAPYAGALEKAVQERLVVFEVAGSLDQVCGIMLTEFADLLYHGNNAPVTLRGWLVNNTVLEPTAQFLIQDQAKVYTLGGLVAWIMRKVDDAALQLSTSDDRSMTFACRDIAACVKSAASTTPMFPHMDFEADLGFKARPMRGHVVSSKKLLFFGPLTQNSAEVAQAKIVKAPGIAGPDPVVRLAEPKTCKGYADLHGSEIAPWVTVLAGRTRLSYVVETDLSSVSPFSGSPSWDRISLPEGLIPEPRGSTSSATPEYVIFASIQEASDDAFYAVRFGRRRARFLEVAAFSDGGDASKVSRLALLVLRIGEKNYDRVLGPFSSGLIGIDEEHFNTWISLPFDPALRNPTPLVQILSSTVAPASVRMRRVGQHDVQVKIHGCTGTEKGVAQLAFAVFPGGRNPPHKAPANLFPAASQVTLDIPGPDENPGYEIDLKLQRYGGIDFEPASGKVFVLPGVPSFNGDAPVVPSISAPDGTTNFTIRLLELQRCGADGVHAAEEVPFLAMQWKTKAGTSITPPSATTLLQTRYEGGEYYGAAASLSNNFGKGKNAESAGLTLFQNYFMLDDTDSTQSLETGAAGASPFLVGYADLILSAAEPFADVEFSRPFEGAQCVVVVTTVLDFAWDVPRWRRPRLREITSAGFQATIEQGAYINPAALEENLLEWWDGVKDKWNFKVLDTPAEFDEQLNFNVTMADNATTANTTGSANNSTADMNSTNATAAALAAVRELIGETGADKTGHKQRAGVGEEASENGPPLLSWPQQIAYLATPCTDTTVYDKETDSALYEPADATALLGTFPNGRRFWAGKLVVDETNWVRIPTLDLQKPRVFATDATSNRLRRSAIRMRQNEEGTHEIKLQSAAREDCLPENGPSTAKAHAAWVASGYYLPETLSVLVVEGI